MLIHRFQGYLKLFLSVYKENWKFFERFKERVINDKREDKRITAF